MLGGDGTSTGAVGASRCLAVPRSLLRSLLILNARTPVTRESYKISSTYWSQYGNGFKQPLEHDIFAKDHIMHFTPPFSSANVKPW